MAYVWTKHGTQSVKWQVLPATPAGLQQMDLGVVRLLNLFQGAAWMTRLAASLAFDFLTQVARND